MNVINNKGADKSIRLSARVSKEEKEIIELRAIQSGMKSVSAYIRHISLTGIIIKYDNKDLKQLIKSLGGIQNNINQIAVRINSTDRYYDEDIQYIKKVINDIWESVTSIQSTLQVLGQ